MNSKEFFRTAKKLLKFYRRSGCGENNVQIYICEMKNLFEVWDDRECVGEWKGVNHD